MRVTTRRAVIGGAAALALTIASSAFVSAFAGGSSGHSDTGTRYITKSGWGGYVTMGKTNAFNQTSAEWQVPAVTCHSTKDLFAPWVGIDGYTSATPHTVEQAGVETSCKTGSPVYRAWYEMAPLPPVYFKGTVKPGDDIKASVVRSGSTYTLTIQNRTRNWIQSTKQTCPKGSTCPNNSAEAVLESPTRSYPDFGSVDFRHVTVNNKPLAVYKAYSINSVNSQTQAETQNTPLRFDRFSVDYALE
ncbi:G1 family glutamic endopeptidase [Streptomyces sp. NPDC007205]|uniref:G1 family glutamic endopeptidase n=1 Tax=Streptomyces sp. NPDC007205 TaxID=3154316 RepID=UPI0033D427A5